VYPCVYACVAYLDGYMCECIMSVCWFLILSVCSTACCSISDSFGEIWTRCRRSGSDSELCLLCTQYMAIRRLIHGMIHISVPVHAVKTRRRFGFKTASFHVSVCSCVFLYLLLSVCVYILLLSFHLTFFYILSIWILIPLHETSVISHHIYVVDMSLYQHHFMCW